MGLYTAIRLREVPEAAAPPTPPMKMMIELPDIVANALGGTLRTWEVRERGAPRPHSNTGTCPHPHLCPCPPRPRLF